jgi:hypothetical protein
VSPFAKVRVAAVSAPKIALSWLIVVDPAMNQRVAPFGLGAPVNENVF